MAMTCGLSLATLANPVPYAIRVATYNINQVPYPFLKETQKGPV